MKTKILNPILFFLVTLIIVSNASAQPGNQMKEAHRPQIHFSPKAHWMNDPNGMVYYKVCTICFFNITLTGPFGAPCTGGMLPVRI